MLPVKGAPRTPADSDDQSARIILAYHCGLMKLCSLVHNESGGGIGKQSN